MKSKIEGLKALESLRPFMGNTQRRCMVDGMRGEEGQFFIDKACEMADLIAAMPKTYEQDGKGDQAIVSLHYFAGGQANFWITEKDAGCEDDHDQTSVNYETRGQQIQAFGMADLFNDGGELGYISIQEIIDNRGELDLHFKPRTLADVRAKHEGVTA